MEVGKIVQLSNTLLEEQCRFLLNSLARTIVTPEVSREMLFLEEQLERQSSKSWVAMVREFHENYGIPIFAFPQDVDDDIFELCRDLIDEEYNELDRAMSHSPFNPANIADAIADLIYVLIGTALTYGIPLDEVFAEVHRSNMTKDGTRRADGKILRGESFEPPKIKEILDRYSHVQTTPSAPA